MVMIAECKCGQPLLANNEYCPQCHQKNPRSTVGAFGFVPWWGWLFVVACGAIPIVTMGGALPGALGFGAAAACAGISKRPDWPIAGRVAACAGITVAAWVGFGVIVLGAARIGS
jgi:hypothetical protein